MQDLDERRKQKEAERRERSRKRREQMMLDVCDEIGVDSDSAEVQAEILHNIENKLRELGFGDVSVNKKMKDFNKILYEILLKIEKDASSAFKINEKLIFKYFKLNTDITKSNYIEFERYFVKFYEFCFEVSPENMIRDAIKFKN